MKKLFASLCFLLLSLILVSCNGNEGVNDPVSTAKPVARLGKSLTTTSSTITITASYPYTCTGSATNCLSQGSGDKTFWRVFSSHNGIAANIYVDGTYYQYTGNIGLGFPTGVNQYSGTYTLSVTSNAPQVNITRTYNYDPYPIGVIDSISKNASGFSFLTHFLFADSNHINSPNEIINKWYTIDPPVVTYSFTASGNIQKSTNNLTRTLAGLTWSIDLGVSGLTLSQITISGVPDNYELNGLTLNGTILNGTLTPTATSDPRD